MYRSHSKRPRNARGSTIAPSCTPMMNIYWQARTRRAQSRPYNSAPQTVTVNYVGPLLATNTVSTARTDNEARPSSFEVKFIRGRSCRVALLLQPPLAAKGNICENELNKGETGRRLSEVHVLRVTKPLFLPTCISPPPAARGCHCSPTPPTARASRTDP